jgi:hypothetical protein
MIKYFIWLIAAILMMYQTDRGFAGEIYQYTDKDGNMIFTDDLNKVPKEKQVGVKSFQSVVSKPQSTTSEPDQSSDTVQSNLPSETTERLQPPEEGNEGETAPEDQMDMETTKEGSDMTSEYPEETSSAEDMGASVESGESDIPATDSEAPESSDDEVITGQFDREKKELDQKLNRMQQEKEKLEKQDVSQMSSMELNAHEERVKDLNARINGLQKEQYQYQERVRRFNDRAVNRNQNTAVGGGLR